MKKIFLVIGLFLSLQTQAQTYLNEDFEDTTGLGGWTLWDYDGDENYWTLDGGVGHSGSGFTSSYSYHNNTALTPDNFVVTPRLTVTSEFDSLSYWVAIYHPDYAAEHYAVLVSTTGTSFDDFTTSLYEQTLGPSDFQWKRKAFSLGQFVGQNIYIAFRHYNCTDNWMIQLDDITGPQLYDPSIAGVTEAKVIPLKVFPIPAKELLNVVSEEQIQNYKVYNMLGEEMISKQIAEKAFSIDVESFETGMYLLNIEFETGIQTQTFIVE